MPLSCPRCLRTLDYSGERPSFCAYCGQALAGSVESVKTSTNVAEDDATVEYHRAPSTVTQIAGSDLGARLPESIGGYRLVRKLGQGGMGSVHEAEEEVSGRRVALKLIAPEFTASSLAVERFLQEGRLASVIAHPRCVFVLAADQANGWPYIVMELMPGHTLKDLVESQGPLPQTDAVLKIMDVIEGLEEAHKLGVIHRDVKPSNCFLDLENRVKIGDFGLSKSLVESDSNLTKTGSFLGTPHYASPEQIKGEVIDERSDVYSVAATLFFLLTSKPPHEANDPTVALARIVSESARSIQSLRPEVWSALDQVVQRGLERDRRRRYRSLEEFREALEPFLPGRVTLGRIGLRIGAYVIDKAITFVPIALMYEALHATTRHRNPSAVRLGEIYSGLILFAYFAVFEVIGQATPGKRFFGLRVVSVRRGGQAGWSEALARVSIFAVIVIVPTRLYALLSGVQGFRSAFGIGILIQAASVPLLFLTARASNGWRGLHEILSWTAVVSLSRRLRRRGARGESTASRPELHVSRPEGIPATVGPFKIDAALVWTLERRLLLGEDQALGRKVWVVLRPMGTTNMPPARQNCGRLARPRWLNSGELDGWSWEAFVAPNGQTLADRVTTRGRLDWHSTREILEALASEFEAATDDGTLPDSLALDRVWVQPDGRVLLMDPILDPLPGERRVVEGETRQARALELLRCVAICAMSGKIEIPAEPIIPVGGPVPGHAIPIVERICRIDKPYATVGEFRADLDQTREQHPDLTPATRISHAAYTLVGTTIKSWLLPFLSVAALFFFYRMAHVHRPPEPSEEFYDSIFLFQSLLWVLLAMLVRDGIGGWMFGVTVVRANGQRATRLRLAWREASRWLPLIVLDLLFEMIPPESPFVVVRYYGGMILTLALPFVYVAHGLIYPGRYLNDRLAGTAVVPK
jgi:uncharacterized RDD family membrane protein YckC